MEKLGGVYKKWLDEDVRWIITDEELSAFKKLTTNAERDQFIEAFWQRRDPTPDTAENEYKEEHYRRIAYANEHYAAGMPGWKTDRGRIYITFGPPTSSTPIPWADLTSIAGRRRRFHHHFPVRSLALPLPGRHRAGNRDRVC